MAQCRWIAIFCLGLLLPQFSSVFSECIVNDDGEAKEEEDETDQEENDTSKDVQDDTDEATPEKRNFLSGLAPLLIKGLKMGLKVGEKLATTVDLSVKIPVAIGGCQTWYPSIQENWDKVKLLSKQLKNITSQIDQITLKAAITQCYARSGLRQYKKTRVKMEKLTNTEQIVFNAMSPELGKALQSSTENIKEVIRKKSGTAADKVDAMQVESMYSSGLQKAFNSIKPVLTLAVPGFKQIYEHIKKTVIASKIIELEEDLDVELGFKGSPSEHQELSGSMFLAIKNPGTGKRVRAAVTEVVRKYNAAHDLYEYVAENADGVFQALSIAMSVWSTVDTIKNCEKKRDDARQSAQNLEQLVANSTEHLEKTKESYQQGQGAWKQIVDVAWEDTFLYAIGEVKKMMADPAVTKDEGLSTTVVQAVQDYINANDDTSTPSNANKLQRKLAYAVPQVSLPLECHKIKAEFFYKVSQKCADGVDTLKGIYDGVKNVYRFDSERYNCAARTESEYVSIEGVENAWKKSIKANGSIKERCLQNNRALIDIVKQELGNGATPNDASRIANNLGAPHYQDDIEVLLRIWEGEERLPIGVQSLICNVKDMINDDQEGYEMAKESYPGLTLDMYRNQDCSKFEQRKDNMKYDLIPK